MKNQTNQPTLFDALETGEQLRDEGMQKAIDHADEVEEQWSVKAYNFLVEFLDGYSGVFMVEDFRRYCEDGLPDPPSARAFGAIIVKAAKAGIVEHCGYGKTKNPKAHKTPAALWVKC